MTQPRLDAGAPRILAGRYQLLGKLADGALATVWRANDQVLGRDVAVKLLHAELTADHNVASLFRHEAVNAANLNHPGIVRVFDTGEHDGIPYLVMELVEGRTLREVLRASGSLPAAKAARIAGDVAIALDYAHRAGVVHRDVKPANILLCRDGQVKVADFSIARAAGVEDVTRTGDMLGTAGYLAPEQVRGEEVDSRADIYSLGVCLYEMLTGRAPFKTQSALQTAMAHLKSEPLPPRAVRAGVPRELDAVVMRAMNKDRTHRFPSAQAMASALAGIAGQHDHDGPGQTLPTTGDVRQPQPYGSGPTTGGFLRHEGRPLGLTLLAVALLVIAGFLLVKADVITVPRVNRPATTVSTAPAAQEPLRAQAAGTFDPDDPQQAGEHDERAPLATDGDEDTAWRTDSYNSAALGGLKQGVGLVVDAGAPARARRLELDLVVGGGAVEIYAADERAGSLDGWTRVARSAQLDESNTLELDSGSYRYYLVWFTELPAVSGTYRAEVQEVRLRT
jgi:hypothetical protein